MHSLTLSNEELTDLEVVLFFYVVGVKDKINELEGQPQTEEISSLLKYWKHQLKTHELLQNKLSDIGRKQTTLI